jgi:predicted RNA-binding Zn-ribbon protein involved in translation (DUF1610 family)
MKLLCGAMVARKSRFFSQRCGNCGVKVIDRDVFSGSTDMELERSSAFVAPGGFRG